MASASPFVKLVVPVHGELVMEMERVDAGERVAVGLGESGLGWLVSGRDEVNQSGGWFIMLMERVDVGVDVAGGPRRELV